MKQLENKRVITFYAKTVHFKANSEENLNYN